MSCKTFTEYMYSLYGHAYEFVMHTYDPKRSSKSMQLRPSTEQEFFGSQLALPTITCVLDKRTNLPISVASSASRKPSAHASQHVCVTEEHNQNLSHAQKELLRWYFPLGHLGCKTIQMLLWSRVLG